VEGSESRSRLRKTSPTAIFIVDDVHDGDLIHRLPEVYARILTKQAYGVTLEAIAEELDLDPASARVLLTIAEAKLENLRRPEHVRRTGTGCG